MDLEGDAVRRIICGFRFDLFHLEMKLLAQDVGKLIVDTVRGLTKQFRTHFMYGVNVRVTQAPYPHAEAPPSITAFENLALTSGMSVTGLRMDDGLLYPASVTGELFTISGAGLTIKEAQNEAYEQLALVAKPGMQFRVDIGSVALRTIGKILSFDAEKLVESCEKKNGNQGET